MKFSDPFKILSPNKRCAPTQSQMDAFQNAYEKLLPPLVYKIRLAVAKLREENYKGASETSKSLLNFWFNQEHLIGKTKFSFFFSQREAVVDVLGFEFEMGLTPQFIQELKEKGVSITLKYIPKDVFDKRAVEKGQVKFFDVAYLNTKETIKGNTIIIELTDFVTHYTQDDVEEIQQSMRKGSKVIIEDGQILKLEKTELGVISKELV